MSASWRGANAAGDLRAWMVTGLLCPLGLANASFNRPSAAVVNCAATFEEMNAVYDTLTRWDPTTQKYSMRMAESVTPNADNTEWTVKIKPNIKFTDGTDYDAEAVKFGINRHRVGITTVKVPVGLGDTCKEYFACPRNNMSSTAYVALIDDIQVVEREKD